MAHGHRTGRLFPGPEVWRSAYRRRTLAAAAICVGWALASAEGDRSELAAEAAPEPLDWAHEQPDFAVAEGHPRLIVGGVRGVPVADLKAACQSDLLGPACGEMGTSILDDGMRYLLSDDAAAAARVKGRLMAGVSCGDRVQHTGAGGHALAYDWIAPSIANPAEKERIEASLAACGSAISDALAGEGVHLWSGWPAQASALALIALALDDEPRVPALRAAAAEHFRRTTLEAMAVTGGAWPESLHFTRTRVHSASPPQQYLIDAILAWNSAVVVDVQGSQPALLDNIRGPEGGDWLRGLGLLYVYGTVQPYGDGGRPTFLRYGDLPRGQLVPTRSVRPLVDTIARIHADGALAGWGSTLEAFWPFIGEEGTIHPMFAYSLPYAFPLDVVATPLDELALGRIWGRRTVGLVMARSGWDAGATQVSFRAGAWMTPHQHLDQGHVDIWHRGPLLVDSGAYAREGTRHREGYYSRTIAHNTIVVKDPDEVFHGPPGTGSGVNDGGQRVHAFGQCALCIQSVSEWQANLGDGLHFEAGRVEAFMEDGDFMVVTSDLTGAYNSEAYAVPPNSAKVHSVQRDVAYIRPDVILVTDRVGVTGRGEAPRFLLHLPRRPELEELAVVEGSSDDGILTGSRADFVMDNGTGGRLGSVTLLPEDPKVTLIGGSRYRYWVDGQNQVDGALFEEDPPVEPGLWRLEVGPTGAGGDHLLMHGLFPGDVGTQLPTLELVDVAADPSAGEVLGVLAESAASGRTLLLQPGGVPRGEVTFAQVVLPPTTDVLAWGLSPGRYAVRLSQTGQRLAYESTAEGVLWLSDPMPPQSEPRVLELGLCPAPREAGSAWVDLCREPATATPTVTATATVRPSATSAPEGPRVHLPALRSSRR